MQLGTFRWIAIAEAASFLALLVATFVKYNMENEVGVQLLGPVHGVLWLVYVGLVFAVRSEAQWGLTTTGIVLLASIVPFGGFVVERRMLPPPATPRDRADL
jgi:integral membrane protein